MPRRHPRITVDEGCALDPLTIAMSYSMVGGEGE